MIPVTQHATPPAQQPAIYAPGVIRTDTDYERNRMARFVANHPEYAKLPPSVLLQYATTYRDDKDHALEQEFRDNGILQGARADFDLIERDWDTMPMSDDYSEGSGS